MAQNERIKRLGQALCLASEEIDRASSATKKAALGEIYDRIAAVYYDLRGQEPPRSGELYVLPWYYFDLDVDLDAAAQLAKERITATEIIRPAGAGH